jgi:hypothetical protein
MKGYLYPTVAFDLLVAADGLLMMCQNAEVSEQLNTGIGKASKKRNLMSFLFTNMNIDDEFNINNLSIADESYQFACIPIIYCCQKLWQVINYQPCKLASLAGWNW